MKKRTIIIIGIIAALAVLTILIVKPFKMAGIVGKIKKGDYNAVYVSSFSTANFQFEDYEKYATQKVLPVKVSGMFEMCEALAVSLKFGDVENVYAGLSVNQIPAGGILPYLIEHTMNAGWNINIESRYAGDIKGDGTRQTNAVKELVAKFEACENVTVVWPGFSEALLVNPMNFDSKGLTENQTIYYLMEDYVINKENVDKRCLEFENTLEGFKNGQYEFKDLSDLTIVYLGDSIIAKSVKENSIPSLMNYFCNTNNIDMTVGGATCTVNQKNPDNCLKEQIKNIPMEKVTDSDGRIAVVINIGLNDFFESVPATGNDEGTYENDLREHIFKVKELIPDAEILVMSPTFVHGPMGDKAFYNGEFDLEEFRETAASVAEETGCVYIDNFRELKFDDNNYLDYYEDDIHLNPRGRLKYAENLINHL